MKINFYPDNSNEYINQDVDLFSISSCLSHPVHLLISVHALQHAPSLQTQ